MNRLKYLIIATLVLTLSSCKDKNDVLITVNQYIYHPNLEKINQGVQGVVNEWATENKKTVRYDIQVANGEVLLATQIAKQQALKKPNVILALATPSAQASKRATNKIPIIFGAVTDPVKAGLVDSFEVPGGNVTGASDQCSFDEQFKFFRSIVPNAKKVGIVLNPGESNTEASMQIIRNVVKKYGFEIVEAPVASSSEIFAAAQSLVGRCDIFFVTQDNTVVSGLEAFVQVSRANRIPLFASDAGSVEKGAIATLGIDYYELGREAGKLVVEVLKGKDTAKLPVVVGNSDKVIVNKEAMEYFQITIPEEYKTNAEIK